MIYFTDGGKRSFLTAFALAFEDAEAQITSTQKQLVLGQQTVFVTPDGRAERAEKRLLSFDGGCMRDLFYLLRSGDPAREQIAFRYLKLLAEKKRPVRDMLAEDAVLGASDCIRRVTLEIHRLHGFVRFIESASGALYAPLSPDNDIVDLLVPHFRARLPQYPFVLHDVKRAKAAVYDGQHTFLAPLAEAEIVLSADEAGWQELWRTYYGSVNIPERERLKQMRGYLPVRYRKFMPEFAHKTSR